MANSVGTGQDRPASRKIFLAPSGGSGRGRGYKTHRYAVHAVTQAGRRRAILEHMAEMPAAAATVHRGALSPLRRASRPCVRGWPAADRPALLHERRSDGFCPRDPGLTLRSRENFAGCGTILPVPRVRHLDKALISLHIIPGAGIALFGPIVRPKAPAPVASVCSGEELWEFSAPSPQPSPACVRNRSRWRTSPATSPTHRRTPSSGSIAPSSTSFPTTTRPSSLPATSSRTPGDQLPSRRHPEFLGRHLHGDQRRGLLRRAEAVELR